MTLTTKLGIALAVALLAIGFGLGWWIHPEIPEQVGYNPPLPDSTHVQLITSTTDSSGQRKVDSLMAEIRRRDRMDQARRMRERADALERDTTAEENVDRLDPLPLMVMRRDSTIRYLALAWTEEHLWTAEKKDSSFIRGTLTIPVDPIAKKTDPKVKIDSLWVRTPTGEDNTGKIATMWSLFALVIGLIGGKLL